MLYKQRFRAEMVKKLTAPNAPSHGELARKTGIPQPTLSRWVREATTLDEVASKKSKPPDKKRKHEGRRPASGAPRRVRERTAEEKLQIVLEAAKLSDTELGSFLREKGVFEIELLEWREMALAGLNREPAVRPATPAEVKRARELERELRRKDKALAEAAALIVLKKQFRRCGGTRTTTTTRTRRTTNDLRAGGPGRSGWRSSNALTPAERRQVIAVATSPEMRDLSPKQIVPRLADRGEYVASESTFYRVLRDEALDERHAAVGVTCELAGYDAVLAKRRAEEILGDLFGLAWRDPPAHDIAAEDVEHHVEVEEEPGRRPWKLRDVPGPNLVRAGGDELGPDVRRVPTLTPAVADLVGLRQDPIHRTRRAEVDLLVEELRVDLPHGLVDETLAVEHFQYLGLLVGGERPRR